MTADPVDPAALDRLAEVAVRTGLNLQEGQDLILTAPVEALPLVRRVAAAAYRAGAGLVTPILSDPEVALARYAHARDESFDNAAGWLYDGMAEAFGNDTARMAIVGEDPMLMAEQDPAKVSRAGKANSIAYKPALEKIATFQINWTIAAYPGRQWAIRMFPDMDPDAAQAKLAEAIFAASRVTDENAVANWEAHNARLRKRTDWLNDHRFRALKYSGPGLDLTVGLADGHEWMGGASRAGNGVVCNPNIPTEEVFTTPHAAMTEGRVRATKPLSHQGSLIEGIEVEFRKGRIVEARATKGEAVLRELIDTDEGARRLGEVALVPHSSPISQSGLLFYNTLFDENAACHIALGQCYSKCFVDGDTLTPVEVEERGGNSSMIHVDWMIGGPETDIDGIAEDGTATPVFRKGEWAI